MEIKLLKPFKNFFYRRKIEQNCKYIAKNKKNVLKKLKNKNTFRVIFYVYDCTKWKCQHLYELMLKDNRFEPIIVVTKNAANNLDNPSFQTKEEIFETYNFFKNKGMNVVLGYDFEHKKHIPFKDFNPDIVIYQHPWYVETSQGPVVCSEFALTYYIPYDIPATNLEIEYYLRFYQYVETYFVANQNTKDLYSSKMDNKGSNLKVSGVMAFDYFKNNKKENRNNYVIYAPHWTVNHENTIAYSTFAETGKYMLEYAKTHPQHNWVFKPHPLLKKALIDNKLMTEKEANEYYKDWEDIATACYDGNYLELFNDSKLLITDCIAFLVEYLPTEAPIIRLVSPDIKPFNRDLTKIVNTFYNPENIESLEKYLTLILDKKQDPQKTERLESMNLYPNWNVSEHILNDIVNDISL